jgi:hypothetical protein
MRIPWTALFLLPALAVAELGAEIPDGAAAAPASYITQPPTADSQNRPSEEWVAIQTADASSVKSDSEPIELREVVDQAPVAQPTVITQVPPVTVYMVYAGDAQIPVTYTQTFADVPDQWSGPRSGEIGLGTLGGGGVGATKSARSPPARTLEARSESGSLGGIPWIGMAVGLGITTMAAVMLG